ncbi:MAG: methionine--tRNA ligase [Myxococcota bacterium]
MNESYYITTPIYYVNGAPHIGHAYTTLVADALARFHRLDGKKVFFQTGTDEHGLKIQRAAEQQGISPKTLADQNSDKFKDLFQKLDITFDRFIRTTEDAHKQTVQTIVDRMKANGDIYLAHYKGWYSASDEAYYAEDEIADGTAIASGSPVEWVEEESYFFKLSRYTEPLLQWYKENPECIQPEARRNEVIAFVEEGLRDLSISRTTFNWGIPIPDDPNHVLYVWVDALTNYLSGIGGFEDTSSFDTFWPCNLHLIGKDILRFHAVYWPAFLQSAGLTLPKQIFAHGWWMNEGQKMSKSLGNFIDAFALAERYELDVLRYYLLREVPLGNDGNFVPRRLCERNNSELADNIGNLVNRTFKMTQGYFDGKVPECSIDSTNEQDQRIRRAAQEVFHNIRQSVSKLQLHLALEQLLAFSGELNQYVHHNEPWKLKKTGDTQRLSEVLYHTLEGIRIVGILAGPFLPHASAKILAAFGLSQHNDFTHLHWGRLESGSTLQQPQILFEKFDMKKEFPQDNPASKNKKNAKAQKNKASSTDQQESSSSNADKNEGKIDFKDFMKVELRVAKILTAERVKGAEKLLKLSVDVGEEQPRTVVAGIAKNFEPEALVGLHVATVTNLKPAKLFGIPSQAMLLAVDTPEGSVALTRYPQTIPPGTQIR